MKRFANFGEEMAVGDNRPDVTTRKQGNLFLVGDEHGRQEEKFLASLTSNDPTIRYWGAIGLIGQQKLSNRAVTQLKAATKDRSSAVRIEAAHALARHGRVEIALPVLVESVQHDNLTVVLHAARTIELLGPDARAAIPIMREVLNRAEQVRPPDAPATTSSADKSVLDISIFLSFRVSGSDCER